MANPSYQLWPPVTVNRIVQTLVYRLALHPLIAHPTIVDPQGNPIRINKFRNFDGIEVRNFSGITVSVFPYHFANSDQSTNITVDSYNTGVRFKQHSLGGSRDELSAVDEAEANIVIKLQAGGFSQDGDVDIDVIEDQQTIFEFNYIEFLLRQYADLIAQILRSRGMRRLPRFNDGVPLLATSFVQHCEWPTSSWDRSSNSVLHSASVLWQCKYYVVREWRVPPNYGPIDMNDGNFIVGFILNSLGVASNIYYSLVHHYYIDKDGNPVSRQSLNDPNTGLPYTTLDADLITMIDSAPKSAFDLSLFLKKVGDETI